MGESWRIGCVSTIGSSHEKSGTPCQDSSRWSVLTDHPDTPLLLCVSDGAGSAKRSDEGSAHACDEFINHFSDLLGRGVRCADLVEREFRAWMGECRASLRNLAEEQDAPAKEFACTFLGAIIGKTHCAFIQLGDGGIVVSAPDAEGDYAPVLWPEETEYANVTYFLTGLDAEEHLQIAIMDRRVEEVALFSDGLQRLALQMATKSAHGPFFRAMFGPLRNEPAGLSQRHDDWLREFMNSKGVLQRTDDDKSLAMATRTPAIPVGASTNG